MVQSLLLNIIGILGFVILLYIGMRISKYKTALVKVGGYLLIVIKHNLVACRFIHPYTQLYCIIKPLVTTGG